MQVFGKWDMLQLELLFFKIVSQTWKKPKDNA